MAAFVESDNQIPLVSRLERDLILDRATATIRLVHLFDQAIFISVVNRFLCGKVHIDDIDRIEIFHTQHIDIRIPIPSSLRMTVLSHTDTRNHHSHHQYKLLHNLKS